LFGYYFSDLNLDLLGYNLGDFNRDLDNLGGPAPGDRKCDKGDHSQRRPTVPQIGEHSSLLVLEQISATQFRPAERLPSSLHFRQEPGGGDSVLRR
jgi:hypothetical protein